MTLDEYFMYLHNARYAVNTISQVDDYQHQLDARKPPIGYNMVHGCHYDILMSCRRYMCIAHSKWFTQLL